MTTDGRSIFEDKARKGFRFLDLNKDGLITREEMARNGEIIATIGSTTKLEVASTRSQFTKWADALFPEGTIDEPKFCKKSYELWRSDPETLADENVESYRNIFTRLDVNKDGSISEEELAQYFKAFGYEDKKFVKKVFIALDENKDGLISEKEFVEAFSKYWTDEPVYEFLYDPPHQD